MQRTLFGSLWDGGGRGWHVAVAHCCGLNVHRQRASRLPVCPDLVVVVGPGVYTYKGSGAVSTLTCTGSTEIPLYGVGCSMGGGGTVKVLPWNNPGPTTTPAVVQGSLCQDIPNIFGACCIVTVYDKVSNKTDFSWHYQ